MYHLEEDVNQKIENVSNISLARAIEHENYFYQRSSVIFPTNEDASDR